MTIAVKMRDNRLRLRLKRINNDNIIKKIGDIRIEGNPERGRLKKKQMEIIRKDIKAQGVDENIIWIESGKIRVAAWGKSEDKKKRVKH